MNNYSTENVSLENLHGKVEFCLTNDYLFRAVFQTNEKALTGLICSLLHLEISDVKKTKVTNPIELGKTIKGKEFWLDIKVLLNSSRIINLEMQVNNRGNWEQRSLSYTCRLFDSLNSGDEYQVVTPVVNIGILGFSLKAQEPEFYSSFKLTNAKTGMIFSDDFEIRTLDLTKIHLATEEDKRYNIDKWASLFKADTWEKLKDISKQNVFMREAAKSMYIFAEDERVREELIRQKEFEADQRWLHKTIDEQKSLLNEKDRQIAVQDTLLNDKDRQIAVQDTLLNDKDRQIAVQDTLLNDKDRQIAELEAIIAEMKQKNS